MYALDQHEPDDLPLYPHRDVITLNAALNAVVRTLAVDVAAVMWW